MLGEREYVLSTWLRGYQKLYQADLLGQVLESSRTSD